jgi:hypothetical protein
LLCLGCSLVVLATIAFRLPWRFESDAKASSSTVKYAVRDADEPLSDLDYEEHIAQLRDRLPTTDQFHITICKPFVVIGNEAPDVVERRARDTVEWAVKRLQEQYFEATPDRIIDIWLFKDKATYEQYNEELFGAAPHTPFGYYSSARNALVMNIATGGGTLVHEIVHPFVEANFPTCPAWFNEGLASLYEQCSDREGRIWGSTNWRLAGLQRTISDGELPTFQELCSTSTADFYNSTRGSNYAQARYLCYYLQENELLEKYYDEFVANCDDDPSGYATLVRVLGDPEMEQFQKDWEKFVLRLRFR